VTPFPNSIYLMALLAFGVVFVGVVVWMGFSGVATFVLDSVVPSRRRARQRRRVEQRELMHARAEAWLEERRAPIRADAERRRRAREEWEAQRDAVADPLMAAWLDAHPDHDGFPEDVLADIFARAEKQIGPAPD
jgi:hypothetical protein